MSGVKGGDAARGAEGCSVSTRERLVVVGNGMAGARVLEEILRRDVERRFSIGVFGEEPHGNYNRILLSGVLSGQQAVDDIMLNPLAWYQAQGVRLHAGVPAERIDREARAVYGAGGVVEPYERLILATGSSPALPPIDGLLATDAGAGGALDEGQTRTPNQQTRSLKLGVFAFRTVDDCRQMLSHAARCRRVAVIGGGLLGLEAARGLAARGLEVHVAHAAGHLMNAQLDATAGEMLERTLRTLGIQTRLEARTTAVLGHGSVTGLAFSDGTTLSCDMVVLACGVRPNVALARACGLTVNRGVVVDDQLRSPDDARIHAIGECAEHRGQLYGLVAPGWEQAHILAQHLTEPRPSATYSGSKLSTKLKVADVELAAIGEPEAREGDEVVQYVEPLRGVYKKIVVRQGRLAGAILLGDAMAAATLIQTYDRNLPVPEDRAHLLFPGLAGQRRGADAASLPESARVCTCNGVTKGEILRCIFAGASSVQRIGEATRAGTGCGSCTPLLHALLDQAAETRELPQELRPFVGRSGDAGCAACGAPPAATTTTSATEGVPDGRCVTRTTAEAKACTACLWEARPGASIIC